MKHSESKLQQSCVRWFDYQYPNLRYNLFAIPNGGARGKIEASIMKGEGVRAGVADLFFAKEFPSLVTDVTGIQYHGLFIEMKFERGKQTVYQKEFQRAVEKQGYRYEVIYNFDSFKNLIETYLK